MWLWYESVKRKDEIWPWVYSCSSLMILLSSFFIDCYWCWCRRYIVFSVVKYWVCLCIIWLSWTGCSCHCWSRYHLFVTNGLHVICVIWVKKKKVWGWIRSDYGLGLFLSRLRRRVLDWTRLLGQSDQIIKTKWERRLGKLRRFWGYFLNNHNWVKIYPLLFNLWPNSKSISQLHIIMANLISITTKFNNFG